jgi:hypothetical protein
MARLEAVDPFETRAKSALLRVTEIDCRRPINVIASEGLLYRACGAP